MELKINDYYEPEHFRAICENNYDVSRTCEYEKNEMYHIHNRGGTQTIPLSGPEDRDYPDCGFAVSDFPV